MRLRVLAQNALAYSIFRRIDSWMHFRGSSGGVSTQDVLKQITISIN